MSEVNAPQCEVQGNPISRAGYNSALQAALNRMENEKETLESAAWVGAVTLRTGRVVNVGVFVRARKVEETEQEQAAQEQAETAQVSLPPRRRSLPQGV